MPNWTRNIIQIGQNVPQERFEAVMLKMLRRDSRKNQTHLSPPQMQDGRARVIMSILI